MFDIKYISVYNQQLILQDHRHMTPCYVICLPILYLSSFQPAYVDCQAK